MTAVDAGDSGHSRFLPVYARLGGGLAAIWLGGWAAALLDSRGDGGMALALLVAGAMLAGRLGGPVVWAVVLVEAAVLALVALRLPVLIYVWADLGPLGLALVALIQAPVAFAAARVLPDAGD